jgi:hypothetical protein
MKFFYERLAKRLEPGQDVTFEKQACALDLEAALHDIGKPCHVTPEGHRWKVWVHAACLELSRTVDSGVPAAKPAEIPAPAAMKGKETAKPAQNIPNFISKASQPALAILPAKEKRRRFADLAKQQHLETGSELAEEQAQLELSFSPAKKTTKRTKKS